jgi:cytoskeletal protein CcmA (bactofilin family)
MWRQEPANSQPRPQAAGAPAPEERRIAAWVGKSLVFKGKVMSSEDITIDGRLEGSVEVHDHTLTVGPDAHIQADVDAKIVTILGAVKGTIIAREKVEIRETGSVEGNIVAPHVAMADGAWLRGRIDDQPRPAESRKPA